MAKPFFGHEPPAIAVSRVLSVGAILAGTVIVVVLVIHFALSHWIAPRHASVAARIAAIPPAPRLQPHPDNDLAELRGQKHDLLSTSKWLDQNHDFARIPIERAMALYVKQHAPASAKDATATPPRSSAP